MVTRASAILTDESQGAGAGGGWAGGSWAGARQGPLCRKALGQGRACGRCPPEGALEGYTVTRFRNQLANRPGYSFPQGGDALK